MCTQFINIIQGASLIKMCFYDERKCSWENRCGSETLYNTMGLAV